MRARLSLRPTAFRCADVVLRQRLRAIAWAALFLGFLRMFSFLGFSFRLLAGLSLNLG